MASFTDGFDMDLDWETYSPSRDLEYKEGIIPESYHELWQPVVEPHPNIKAMAEYHDTKFACPFPKAFPHERSVSRPCKEPGFDNISRLKQHIFRCHTGHSCRHCPTVHNVATTGSRSELGSICKFYIDDTMAEQLRKRSVGSSSWEQWYRIWDLLFPQEQRPQSPYVAENSLYPKSLVIRDKSEEANAGTLLTSSIKDTLMDSPSSSTVEIPPNYIARLLPETQEIAPTLAPLTYHESHTSHDSDSDDTGKTVKNQGLHFRDQVPPFSSDNSLIWKRRPDEENEDHGFRDSNIEPRIEREHAQEGRPDVTHTMLQRISDSEKLFACPFYLHDRSDHPHNGYKRISDLRQHLQRKHKQLLHCHICGYVFQGLQSVNDHSCTQSSQPNVKLQPTWLSDDKWDAIMKRARVRGMRSGDERWYEIWDILFPDSPRPPSTRLGTVEMRVASEVRDMVQRYLDSSAFNVVVEDSATVGGFQNVEVKNTFETLSRALLEDFCLFVEGKRGNIRP